MTASRGKMTDMSAIGMTAKYHTTAQHSTAQHSTPPSNTPQTNQTENIKMSPCSYRGDEASTVSQRPERPSSNVRIERLGAVRRGAVTVRLRVWGSVRAD